jgi:benzoylformate decarboxylase
MAGNLEKGETKMNARTGRFAIIEQLLADGITHMFGNPGTVEQGFLDALESYPDFKYITTLQETVAVAMADGYARKTKKPTVVQLHSGVGLGNGVGMMYQALRGHAPLVVLAGEAGLCYDAMDAQMACDLVSVARPVTKWASRVVDAKSLLRVLRRAIKIAATPPMGPVFVSLPMDVLDEINEEPVVPTSFLHTRAIPDEKVLKEVAGLLSGAKKTMLIIGDGIAFSGAQEELSRVAELVGAEVWGADSSEVNISAAHPLYQGLLGHMFGEQSQRITNKADAILICGTYTFPEVFPVLEGAFAPNAKTIHIDLNSYEIAKNFPVDIGIVSDPKRTLGRLADILDKEMSLEQKTLAATRAQNIGAAKATALQKAYAADHACWNDEEIHMSKFLSILTKYLPADVTIFDEALTCSFALNQYIAATQPGTFYQTRGGSLGVGIPGAMGIKLAAPEEKVLAFVGDGGSMYTFQALWTAAHYKIDAKFIICNNHSYKLLKLNIKEYWQERHIPEHLYPRSFTLDKPEIRFDELAKALGVPAFRVEKPAELESVIKLFLETQGPCLLDLVIAEELPK